MTKTIEWLHVSDLHACSPRSGWDSARVLDTLTEDLKELSKNHGLQPRLLFFTGDLAFGQISSKKGECLVDQFDYGARFIDALRRSVSPEIEKANVFLVPGNHDVDRNAVTPSDIAWLDKDATLDEVHRMIRDVPLQWRRYMERLSAYAACLTANGYDHLLADPQRLCYSATREVTGTRVGIAGLNSVWSCSRELEKGRLWTGTRWQAETALAALRAAGLDVNNDLTVALVHHPATWYVHSEGHLVWRDLLQQRFRVCLHGHEHESWVETPNARHVTISAGACYERSDKPNGYNIARLDVTTGKLEVWLRNYSSIAGGGWTPLQIPRQTDERGIWHAQVDIAAGRVSDGLTAPRWINGIIDVTHTKAERSHSERTQSILKEKMTEYSYRSATINSAQTTLTEALNNAFEHACQANSDGVRVLFDVDVHRTRVTVLNPDGRRVEVPDLLQTASRQLQNNKRMTRGRGLLLMSELADDLLQASAGDGITAVFERDSVEYRVQEVGDVVVASLMSGPRNVSLTRRTQRILEAASGKNVLLDFGAWAQPIQTVMWTVILSAETLAIAKGCKVVALLARSTAEVLPNFLAPPELTAVSVTTAAERLERTDLAPQLQMAVKRARSAFRKYRL
jgi:anti-sigma regulatory factor (Ser/Thr protein kinase)